MAVTQEQLLNDIKTKIYQYIYRSTEMPFDSLFKFIQENSSSDIEQNKIHLVNVFSALNTAIMNYKLDNGDFRSYLHLCMVNILTEEYLDILYINYSQNGYNLIPETNLGSISGATVIANPQNSNYPDIRNQYPDLILIPKSKYSFDTELPSPTVSKTDYVPYIPPVIPCFGPLTWILLADGTSKLLWDIVESDEIISISESNFLTGIFKLATGKVTSVIKHIKEDFNVSLYKDIMVTPEHPWGVMQDNHTSFLATSKLTLDVSLCQINNGEIIWSSSEVPIPAGTLPEVRNLTTELRTYLVSAHASGPWSLVHNEKLPM